jgi:hypothetical protein
MRRDGPIVRTIIMATVLCLGACGCAAAGPADADLRLLGDKPVADRLVRIDTTAAFALGTSDHVKVVDQPAGVGRLELDDAAAGPDSPNPTTGIWTSEPGATEFGFTELVASWNVTTPASAGVRFFVRARDAATGEWSPWLYMGQWGRTSAGGTVTRFERGLVDVDTLELRQPASAWQVRAELQNDRHDAPGPVIRRIAVVYSGVCSETVERAPNQTATSPSTEPATQPDAQPRRRAVNLPVPFRAQHDTPRSMRSEVCSPTSVSMVLAYWGIGLPTVQNCQAIWDPEYRLYGNWTRAVARAGELGLDAWVTRFRDWDAVRAELDAGRPVIAAIEFKAGEFPGNVLDSSAGHLIVIRGFTPSGDAICNDPASKKKGNAVVYNADALARAWFRKTGVAYIIHGNKPATASEPAPQ